MRAHLWREGDYSGVYVSNFFFSQFSLASHFISKKTGPPQTGRLHPSINSFLPTVDAPYLAGISACNLHTRTSQLQGGSNWEYLGLQYLLLISADDTNRGKNRGRNWNRDATESRAIFGALS